MNPMLQAFLELGTLVMRMVAEDKVSHETMANRIRNVIEELKNEEAAYDAAIVSRLNKKFPPRH